MGKNLPPSCGLLSKALWTSKEKRKVAKLRSSHAEDVLYHTSGSARVFGYTVFRGFLNRVYGILQLKDEYSVYHFLWISGIRYTMLPLILVRYIWMNFGYFWVFWRFFFGYTGITLPPVFSPTSAHLCKRKLHIDSCAQLYSRLGYTNLVKIGIHNLTQLRLYSFKCRSKS